MSAFKAFENLLIENFQSSQQLLQKIAQGFGKPSACLSKPEVNLLYQLLQQQELTTIKYHRCIVVQ